MLILKPRTSGSQMKDCLNQKKPRLNSYCFAGMLSLGLLFCLPASAYVLDNFTSGKNGWTDSLNGGTANVASGQFTITTAVANGSLTASTKTASPVVISLGTSFTPVSGHTTEIRVDANNTFNASTDTNALAVLAL